MSKSQNIFQKYHESGYRGQFLGQQPHSKIPSRISCVTPWAGPQWTGVAKWPERCLDPEDFDLYHEHHSGVCLKTKYFPFIDIDLEDPLLVIEVVNTVFSHLGSGMVRTRSNSNRVGICYRTETPFSGVSSVRFRRHYEGRKAVVNEQVEFLSDGRQFVCEGIHTSGVPYQIQNWMPALELPIHTEKQILELRASIIELIPDDYIIEPHKSTLKGQSIESSDHIDLYEDFEITLWDGTTTVGDIIRDPQKYHGMDIPDPYEPEYSDNKRIAKIWCQGHPIIKSFAHGGITYHLHANSLISQNNNL